VPQLATVLYSHVLSALFICPHLFPFFFFSIIPRPPISTLFPYTTLFRSHPETRSLRYTLRKVRYAMCCSFSPSLVRASWGPRTCDKTSLFRRIVLFMLLAFPAQ